MISASSIGEATRLLLVIVGRVCDDGLILLLARKPDIEISGCYRKAVRYGDDRGVAYCRKAQCALEKPGARLARPIQYVAASIVGITASLAGEKS